MSNPGIELGTREFRCSGERGKEARLEAEVLRLQHLLEAKNIETAQLRSALQEYEILTKHLAEDMLVYHEQCLSASQGRLPSYQTTTSRFWREPDTRSSPKASGCSASERDQGDRTPQCANAFQNQYKVGHCPFHLPSTGQTNMDMFSSSIPQFNIPSALGRLSDWREETEVAQNSGKGTPTLSSEWKSKPELPQRRDQLGRSTQSVFESAEVTCEGNPHSGLNANDCERKEGIECRPEDGGRDECWEDEKQFIQLLQALQVEGKGTIENNSVLSVAQEEEEELPPMQSGNASACGVEAKRNRRPKPADSLGLRRRLMGQSLDSCDGIASKTSWPAADPSLATSRYEVSADENTGNITKHQELETKNTTPVAVTTADNQGTVSGEGSPLRTWQEYKRKLLAPKGNLPDNSPRPSVKPSTSRNQDTERKTHSSIHSPLQSTSSLLPSTDREKMTRTDKREEGAQKPKAVLPNAKAGPNDSGPTGSPSGVELGDCESPLSSWAPTPQGSKTPIPFDVSHLSKAGSRRRGEFDGKRSDKRQGSFGSNFTVSPSATLGRSRAERGRFEPVREEAGPKNPMEKSQSSSQDENKVPETSRGGYRDSRREKADSKLLGEHSLRGPFFQVHPRASENNDSGYLTPPASKETKTKSKSSRDKKGSSKSQQKFDVDGVTPTGSQQHWEESLNKPEAGDWDNSNGLTAYEESMNIIREGAYCLRQVTPVTVRRKAKSRKAAGKSSMGSTFRRHMQARRKALENSDDENSL